MVYAVIFLTAMFLAYSYLVFELVDTFLAKATLKKALRIPVAIANTIVAFVFVMVGGSVSLNAYLAIGVILFVEFVIFHQDKYSCSLFCALACLIHVMVMRSLCVVGFALATNSTIYNVVSTPLLLALSTGVAFLVLNIAVFTVLKVIPAKSIRIINQHNELLLFMIAWLSVFCVYLLVNSKIYSTPNDHPTLLINQVIAPISILVGTYIVLFFSIKTSVLLGYKEKNEELQHTMEKERQYRITIDKDVFRVVEVNFNDGKIASGFEDYKELLGDAIYDYSEMFTYMMRTTVHPEDRDEFNKYLSPLAVLEEFKAGKSEICFDYRRLMPDGNYLWMRVLMALMQNNPSDDVKGFIQIKDIDAEKRQQLELQYKAERDLLTGLYNKGTTELLIAKQLNTHSSNATSGVLFVIDVDNFKIINDRLGHLYGDAVLSELSEALRKVFRDCDIVGRIGGDEFLVFAVGLQSESAVLNKAKNICTAFAQTYANEKHEGYGVSSSIGISVFPKDGKSFEALFKCADIALYNAKAQGKNGYCFYDKTFEMPYTPTRTEIDTHGIVQKSFKDNKIEYIFRLLYGSDETKASIEAALELIAKTFGFSRANIFEFNELSTHFNGVFEWCANGVASVSANYVDMPVSSFDFVVSALGKAGGMFMALPSDFPEYARESYTSIGIKSIVHFSIEERDNLIGVIAFQYCVGDKLQLSDNEFEELRTICQVLSVFMAKRLSNERELRHHQAVEAMMDNMNCISYVVDRETYDVYYENKNTVDITGLPSIGKKCYSSYRGLDVPCDDCPLNHLSPEKTRCTVELYTKKFNLYTKTSAALIDWSNDRNALLISSVDVTEYKL